MFKKKTKNILLVLSLIIYFLLWTKIVYGDTPSTVAESLSAIVLAFFIGFLIASETKAEEDPYDNTVMVVYDTLNNFSERELAQRKFLIDSIKEFDLIVMPYQVVGIMLNNNVTEDEAIAIAQELNESNIAKCNDCTTSRLFSYFVFNIVNSAGLFYAFSKTPEQLEAHNKKIIMFIDEKINGFFEL